MVKARVLSIQEMATGLLDQANMTAEDCEALFYGIAIEAAGLCRRLKEIMTRTEYENITSFLIHGYPKNLVLSNHPTFQDYLATEVEVAITAQVLQALFVYRPLEGLRMIRVLILHPGSDSEGLRATIRHDPISRAGYDAISYTWGDDSKPCTILVDGYQMEIGPNIFNALIHLRHPHEYRVLWADSICINQTDNKEKSAQVAFMPEIYAQAGKVLVYLGEEADGSEMIPELLQKINDAEFDRSAYSSASSDKLKSNGLPPPGDRAWEALTAFLQRPWFTRVWVVQEVVLAREVRFICGNWDLDWHTLFNIANQLGNSHLPIQTTLPDYPSSVLEKAQQGTDTLGMMLGQRLTRSPISQILYDIKQALKPSKGANAEASSSKDTGSEHATRKREIVKACQDLPNLFSLIEHLGVGFPDKILPPSMPILMVLDIFFASEATRPQDRLYALIGLSSDVNFEDFPPDYDETLDQTNLRFGRKLVEKGQGLDVLFRCKRSSYDLEHNSLPSWAPEWTKWHRLKDRPLKLGWAYAGGFNNRTISTTYVQLVDGDPRTLKLSGFRLDSCQNSVLKFPNDGQTPEMSTYNSLPHFTTFFEELEPIFNGDPYFTGESWEEVECRTLIANHLPKNVKNFSDILYQYKDDKDMFLHLEMHLYTRTCLRLNNIEPPEYPPNDWFKKMHDIMIGNSICRTSKGYIGVVPESTTKTDEVFMVSGSNLPFVLRPLQDRPGYYQILGGCYIHGLMNGEAWKLPHSVSEILLA